MNDDLMLSIDWIGYLGSMCVVSAFCMRCMLALRVASIIGNMVFIVYACGAELMPVLLMNSLLLPLNAVRLFEALQESPRIGSASTSGHTEKNEAVIRLKSGARCFAPLV